MNVQLRVNFSRVYQMLDRQKRTLRDMRRLWRAALPVFYSHESEIFEKEGDPHWAPLRAETRAAIGQITTDPYAKGWQRKLQTRRARRYRQLSKHKILQDTGHLKKSVTGPSTYGYVRVTDRSLTVGSKLPYAGFHMTGTRHMPARPFLHCDQPTLNRMADAMLRMLDRI